MKCPDCGGGVNNEHSPGCPGEDNGANDEPEGEPNVETFIVKEFCSASGSCQFFGTFSTEQLARTWAEEHIEFSEHFDSFEVLPLIEA